jgi:hypothetical protein
VAQSIHKDGHVWVFAQIDIAAPLDVVWSVLTDFQNWPVWKKGVTKMRLIGPLELSSELHWTSWGVNIVSFIQQVSPKRNFIWSGYTLGIKAIHTWSIQPGKDGVFVHSEESFEGLPARIFAFLIRPVLKHSLKQGLLQLKHECEGRQKIPASTWSRPICRSR